MKHGLLKYEDARDGHYNIGDYIQSLAAEQYLPKVDDYIFRDQLNQYTGDDIKLILNGWFTYRPDNWPPASAINPLFVSFHLNSHYAPALLAKEETIQYLKKQGPIGCRDFTTVEMLKEKGIEAYYSSCLTTTLDLKYASTEKNDDIIFVDVLFKNDLKSIYKLNKTKIAHHILNGKIFKINEWSATMKKLFPQEILEKAQYVPHVYNEKRSVEERFMLARTLLKKYASAKLVVTSRIHCALPCLAMGTPVIFVYGGLGHASETSRLKGTIEHMNLLPTESMNDTFGMNLNILDPKKIDWLNLKNPDSYKEYSTQLKKKCQDFITRS